MCCGSVLCYRQEQTHRAGIPEKGGINRGGHLEVFVEEGMVQLDVEELVGFYQE